jgi:hypothetical protein
MRHRTITDPRYQFKGWSSEGYCKKAIKKIAHSRARVRLRVALKTLAENYEEQSLDFC